jgi:hypothetical protein
MRRKVGRASVGFHVGVALLVVGVVVWVAGRGVALHPTVARSCSDSWAARAQSELWGSPKNWSTGRVPGPSDRACIPAAARAVVTDGVYRVGSLDIRGSLVISSRASLSVQAPISSRVARLMVGGGGFAISQALSVSTSFRWTGGRIGGPGVMRLLKGVRSSIDPGPTDSVTLGLGRFENDGVLFWSSGAWRGGPGTLIRNMGTMVVNSESPVGIRAATSGAHFVLVNQGLFERTAGRGKTWIDVPFNNAKMVKVHIGDLVLADGSVPGQIASGDFCADEKAYGIDFHAGDFRLGSDIQTSGTIWVESPVTANDIQGTRATAPNCYR